MSISENVKKALYMESAGYCQNPNCNCSLLPLFESGKISNIIELHNWKEKRWTKGCFRFGFIGERYC